MSTIIAQMIAANAPLTVRSVKAIVREAMKDERERDLALVQAHGRRLLCQRGLRLDPRPHRQWTLPSRSRSVCAVATQPTDPQTTDRRVPARVGNRGG